MARSLTPDANPNPNQGDSVLNSVKNKKERIGRMLEMNANDRTDIDQARAGDIIALVGCKDTTTGETLCDPENPVILEKMDFPEPVIKVSVEPKTKADQEKMTMALVKLAAEDPSRAHVLRCLSPWASKTLFFLESWA